MKTYSKMRKMVREYEQRRQKEQYEYEANRSALLWAGLMLLLSLWLYAEVKHAERHDRQTIEAK
jgi:hypothetical protein